MQGADARHTAAVELILFGTYSINGSLDEGCTSY